MDLHRTAWKRTQGARLTLAAAGLFLGIFSATPGLASPLSGDAVVRPAMEEERVRFALTLPLRNQAGLNDLLQNLYTPGGAQFRQFLGSSEFDQQFAPTQEQYDTLKSLVRQYGLDIVGETSGRTVLDVEASAATIRNVFGSRLQVLQQADGTQYFAPDQEAQLPFPLSAVGADVAAMNQKPRRTHLVQGGGSPMAEARSEERPNAGRGPSGSYEPADIKTAYDLNSIQNGGQAVALFELSSAHYTDAATYAKEFGLTAPTLTLKTVDGGTSSTGGSTEVMLDIEMVMAVADPGSIVVYTGPNTGSGALDTYSQIANDDLVNQVSTSWGLCESEAGQSTVNAENTVFAKMAAEGIAVFAAAGDSGAYDCGTTLGVDDPASQPYVTGVGGTSLTTTSGQAYASEAVWDSSKTEAGGGGISRFWAVPSYQKSVVSNAATGQFSTTMRNVPDVALDADPNTGFVVYDSVAGGWVLVGGTSDAAPQYAAFWSLVGKGLASAGHTPARAGFANPTLYTLAENATSYARDFHDVTTGTNNYYKAVTGYDDATGWGSYNGANLYADVIKSVGGSSSGGGSSSSGSSSSGGKSSSSSSGSSSSSSSSSSSGGGKSSSSSSSSGGSTSTGSGVPAAPAGLSATGTSYEGYGAVTLNWNASSGATRYYIYLGSSAGGESTTPLGYVTGTSVEVVGLAANTRYYFKVQAYNSAGYSAYSSEVSAVSK